MRLAIGSDHAGFELKKELKKFLENEKHEVADFGTNSSERVDYPEIVFNTAKSVADGKSQFGIFICGSGTGASIVANKVPGVRASLCYGMEIAKLSREHNNANFICLGGRFLAKEEAFKIIKIWLETPFAGGRHTRRIKQIEEIEKRIHNK